MSDPTMRLDHPLPAELLQRTSRGLAAYQNYPVFSWTWLRKRTIVFALAFVGFGMLSALGVGLSGSGLGAAASVFAHSVVGGLAIATSGPSLATLIRHRRLSLRVERPLVFAMLVLGLCISFAADSWASSAIARSLPAPLAALIEPAPVSGASWALQALMAMSMYGLVGGGLAVRRYLDEPGQMARLEREREVAELRVRNQALDAQLGVLQAQIEPHFLFNTLASVRSLIVSSPDAAADMLDALVDYLRATIPRLRHDAVDNTLGQQLEICESYLKVMSLRMGRLEYEMHVDPGLRETRFPALFLINLVENAVKHGIEPKPGRGRVIVTARAENDGLSVSVEDNGVGLGHGLGSGVGLSNLREQIRLRYGDRASFALTGRAEGGALSRIAIRNGTEPEVP